jgi:hypothetical protein
MPVAKGKKGMEQVMHEFKHGELHSGSGGKVKSRKQAIAIGLKQSGMSYYGPGRKAHGK